MSVAKRPQKGVGGVRPGAGRKSSWSSPTKMMRLPGKYESEIVEFARLLDGVEPGVVEFAPRSVSLPKLEEVIDRVLLSIPPGDRRLAKRLFKKLLERLTNNQ